METARSLLLRLLLCSAPFLCVCGTPLYLSSLGPTQDSGLVTPAASTLNIGTARPGPEQTAADGSALVTHVEDGRWNKKKGGRQIPNRETLRGEVVSSASTTARESQKVGEDDSSESWLSPLDDDDVPKQFLSPEMATEGATMMTMQDPLLLPAIGLLPKEDGTESLWTEAARPSGTDTSGPQSQDDATESTMSSESLPLIFEPLEEVSPENTVSDRTRPSSVAVETDSEAPAPLLPDWTSPGQTSGTELLEPVRTSDSSVDVGSEAGADQGWTGAARTSNLEGSSQSARPSLSSLPRPTTTVTVTTATLTTAAMTTQHQQRRPKSRPGFDEMDSDEDPDEDEENSEESVEESEEELTEAPEASTPPPYSLIPPPPVWVQHNQGLMRSWVELIREKAGYVSGMLAPVGIGISGALLLVGAIYSIRTIHRKRRNSFKHQRRKSRQPEQPREPGVSGQDQAMLLADSSEDEF